MNPYLIITGLCCSIIVSGLIPLFASPKVVIENKMKTQAKDWGKHNSFQLRLKRDEQLRQIKEMEEKISKEKEKEQESNTGQKRKRNKTRKRNKSRKRHKTKRNKSKRK